MNKRPPDDENADALADESGVCALPPSLLQAIAHDVGGKVVLVLGAGCSVEETDLPLTDVLAQRCCRELIANNVLSRGDCLDENDLSAVADAVFTRTGHQDDLVNTFPPEKFRRAKPNLGYRIAAALLQEGAVSSVMTLNFDLAASTALSGARDVAEVAGPQDHQHLGACNLIYLHRNVNAKADDLILRTKALKEEWKDAWEQKIVARVASGPVTVFVGLGSPAAVLIEAVNNIVSVIPEGAKYFVVDSAKMEDSRFFAELHIPADRYIQLGWCDFMDGLGQRLAEKQRQLLEQACGELLKAGSWEEGVPDLCERLACLGLLEIGRLRALWLLRDGDYAPDEENTRALLADLLLAVGTVERALGFDARFHPDGVVELRDGDVIRGAFMMSSGCGYLRRMQVEEKLRKRRARLKYRTLLPRTALVAGVPPGVPMSTPVNLVHTLGRDSLVVGADTFELIMVDELHSVPDSAKRLIA